MRLISFLDYNRLARIKQMAEAAVRTYDDAEKKWSQ